MELRKVRLENVIWVDFRPIRKLCIALRAITGRSLGWRTILAPQQVRGVRPQRLRQKNERRVLNVLGVTTLPLVNRRLRQRRRRTHRYKQPS